MSAAVALEPVSSGDGKPDVDLATLQDILYDIVATGGVDAMVDVPLDDVEQFLHEHARTPKTEQDFIAFFEKHGLPTHATPTVVGVNAPAPVDGDAAPVAAARPTALPTAALAPHALQVPESREPVTGAFRIEGGSAPRTLWVMLAAIALLLGGLLGLGYQMYKSMQAELREARQLGESQQRFIEKLESRTEALQQNVSRNGQLIEHVDSRSELLIDSLLPAPLDRD